MEKKALIITLILVALSTEPSISQAGSFVTTRGEDLFFDGKKFYPFGVNYFPSFYNETDLLEPWLHDKYYNLPGSKKQIDKELQKIKELNMNFIIIAGIKDKKYCDNLNDFLSRAKAKGLKTSIAMKHSDPLLNFLGLSNYSKDIEIIRSCNLIKDDTILGYELDWEPSFESRWEHPLPYSAKRRNNLIIQEEWEKWVKKYYGSFEQAFKNWNFTPPPPAAECISHSVPLRALVDKTYSLNFTIKNTGNESWDPKRYHLSFLGTILKLDRTIKPGEKAIFTLDYRVPKSTSKQLLIWWQMEKDDKPFGERCYAKTQFVTENPSSIKETIFPKKLWTPTDYQICNEGQWTSYVVAFNHFMNDLIGKLYKKMVEKYKSVDPNHLVYARIGTPSSTWPSSCINLEYNKRWSVSKYLDIIPEEIYNPINSYNTEGFNKVIQRDRFKAEYNYIGKPIIVIESGITNKCLPAEQCSKEKQRKFYEELYKMVLKSRIKGIATWWFTGEQLDDYLTKQKGYNVFNDFGIVEKLTLKDYPVTQTVKYFSSRLKSQRNYTTNSKLIVDPDKFSSTFNFYKDSADKYYSMLNNWPRILTTCSEKDSSNVEIVCVGNTINDGQCPVKCLQSRFVELEILNKDGNWVSAMKKKNISVKANLPIKARLKIENTQETEWLSGTSKGSVYIITEADGEIISRTPLNRNVPGLTDYDSGEFKFSEGINKKTRVKFYLESKGRTKFGDKIYLNLIPYTGFGNYKGFDFSVSSSIENFTLEKGIPQKITLTVRKISGNVSREINFGFEKSPFGISVFMNRTSCTPNPLCQIELTIYANESAKEGTHTMNIIAVSSSIMKRISLNINITSFQVIMLKPGTNYTINVKKDNGMFIIVFNGLNYTLRTFYTNQLRIVISPRNETIRPLLNEKIYINLDKSPEAEISLTVLNINNSEATILIEGLTKSTWKISKSAKLIAVLSAILTAAAAAVYFTRKRKKMLRK